jgi:hypothetical protein
VATFFFYDLREKDNFLCSKIASYAWDLIFLFFTQAFFLSFKKKTTSKQVSHPPKVKTNMTPTLLVYAVSMYPFRRLRHLSLAINLNNRRMLVICHIVMSFISFLLEITFLWHDCYDTWPIYVIDLNNKLNHINYQCAVLIDTEWYLCGFVLLRALYH